MQNLEQFKLSEVYVSKEKPCGIAEKALNLTSN